MDSSTQKEGLRHGKAVWLGLVGLLVAVAASSYLTRRAVMHEMGLADQRQPLLVKELIRRVRADLAAAEREMRDRNELALFRLKDFEMEINYVVRAGADTKAEVVGIGTDLNIEREKVQKLTLRWVACPQSRIGSAGDATVLSGTADVVRPPKQAIAVNRSAAAAVAKKVGDPDDQCPP